MTVIGTLTAALQLDTSSYQKHLADAQRKTTTAGQQASRAGAGFGALDKNVKKSSGGFRGLTERLGKANPALGGTIGKITSMITPVGLATAGIGAMAAAIGGSVAKVTSLERELRPMIERSRISAESLQLLAEAAKRAGSEDGLEGVVDTSQELQLQLGEIAILGSGRAKDALNALGLSAQELNDLEPEAAWRRTVEAIQQVPDVTARATLAEEIFGGTSEKLAGIVNMTAGEFAALETNVRATADVVSENDLEAARKLNANMGELKASIGGAFTTLGTTVIPVINNLFNVVRTVIPVLRDKFAPIFKTMADVWKTSLQPALKSLATTVKTDLLPALKDVWTAISPVLIPALKIVIVVLGAFQTLIVGKLKAAIEVLSGVLMVVAGVLTGDFSKAWKGIKTIAVGAINFIKAPLDALGPVAQAVGTAISGAFDAAWGLVKTAVGTVVTAFDAAWGAVKTAVGAVGTAISGAFDAAWGLVKTAVGTVVTAFDAAWGAVKTAVGAVGTAISGAFDAAWVAVKTAVGTVVTAFDKAWGLVKTAVGVAGKAISDAFGTAWDVVKTSVGTVVTVLDNAWGVVKTAVGTVGTAIRAVAQILTGDFAGAWLTIQTTALNVVLNIVNAFNGLARLVPGLPEIDTSQIEAQIDRIKEKTNDAKVETDGMARAFGDVATQSPTTATALDGLTTATDAETTAVGALTTATDTGTTAVEALGTAAVTTTTAIGNLTQAEIDAARDGLEAAKASDEAYAQLILDNQRRKTDAAIADRARDAAEKEARATLLADIRQNLRDAHQKKNTG